MKRILHAAPVVLALTWSGCAVAQSNGGALKLQVVGHDRLLPGKVRMRTLGAEHQGEKGDVFAMVRFKPYEQNTEMCAAFIVRGKSLDFFLRTKDQFPGSITYVVGDDPVGGRQGVTVDMSFMPGYGVYPGNPLGSGREFNETVNLACVVLPLPWDGSGDTQNTPAWTVRPR